MSTSVDEESSDTLEGSSVDPIVAQYSENQVVFKGKE